MKKKIIIFIIPILTVMLGLYFYLPYKQKQDEIKHYAFSMNSIDGQVSLSDYDGKYKIVYFGYMYCPDICPTSLSIIASALKSLPKEQADKFQVIFISVDPDRDTLEQLKEYANYFYKGALGITSNEKYLKSISLNYGTYYSKEYLKDSKMNYSVAHTSFVYIMDKNGNLLHKIPHLEHINDVLNIIKKIY